MDDNKRTKVLIVRMNNKELNSLKTKSQKFKSISQYVRNAISEYKDEKATSRIELINELISYYDKYHSMLYHSSANLNQAIKRANELALAGNLSESFLQIEVMPKVTAVMNTVLELRNMLKQITKDASKYNT